MAIITAVTAVLLHHSAMDTGKKCGVVSTGLRVNGGYGSSYCSTVTKQCYL